MLAGRRGDLAPALARPDYLLARQHFEDHSRFLRRDSVSRQQLLLGDLAILVRAHRPVRLPQPCEQDDLVWTPTGQAVQPSPSVRLVAQCPT